MKIDKNVPLPAPSPKRPNRYRWDEMQMGDSVFFGTEYIQEGKTVQDLRNTVYAAARKWGSERKGRRIYFKALVVTEEQFNPDYGESQDDDMQLSRTVKVEGVRVWRVDENGDIPAPPEPIRTTEGSQLSDNERSGGIDAESA